MPTGRSCVWIAALVLSLPAIAPAQPIAVLWYFVPTFESQPTGIAAGPDGALWFTEVLGNKIGRITSAGAITEYPLPTAGSEPNGIAAGPDGALWFAEGVADRIGRTPLTERSPSTRIGRITTVGIVTRYPVPTADSIPIGSPRGRMAPYGLRKMGIAAIGSDASRPPEWSLSTQC